MDDEQNIDPALIQSVLGLSEEDPQSVKLARQQKMADMLRNNAMSQPAGQMVGKIYVPNIAGNLAGMFGAYAAGKAQPEIDKGVADVAQRHIGARQGYVNALVNALRRKQAGGDPNMIPNDGAVQDVNMQDPSNMVPWANNPLQGMQSY